MFRLVRRSASVSTRAFLKPSCVRPTLIVRAPSVTQSMQIRSFSGKFQTIVTQRQRATIHSKLVVKSVVLFQNCNDSLIQHVFKTIYTISCIEFELFMLFVWFLQKCEKLVVVATKQQQQNQRRFQSRLSKFLSNQPYHRSNQTFFSIFHAVEC
jgi:hypothetical protein